MGATVVEYADDYSVAVENGRKNAEKNPYCHFGDDENSRSLFLGYAVAAERLKKQFDQEGIEINEKAPLYVYLPCGAGGGLQYASLILKKVTDCVFGPLGNGL